MENSDSSNVQAACHTINNNSINSDEEYETEEAVVLLELNGIIDPNFLLQEQTPVKVLGIETDEPILQIGHYIFSGEYEDTLGTIIAYEPIQTTDSEGKEIEDYKLVCKTDKKVSMKRIFLQGKGNTKATDLHNSKHEAPVAMDCSESHPDTSTVM